MSPRLIDLHDNEMVWEAAADVLQEEVHHRRGGLRQNQRNHLTLRGCDSSVDIHIFSDHLDRNMRTHTRRCPGAFHLTDTAKAPFILCQNENGAFIAHLFRGNGRFHQRGKVFLNCSCVSRSLFGCLGRGITLRQPWR